MGQVYDLLGEMQGAALGVSAGPRNTKKSVYWIHLDGALRWRASIIWGCGSQGIAFVRDSKRMNCSRAICWHLI